MYSRQQFATYVRNFIFGVEDSLVSTVGLLSGIAAAGVPRSSIILTGVVLIFVEAFSMAVGSFLSEQSATEYMEGENAPAESSMRGGVVMFLSYFASGFIPLSPYLLFVPTTAFWVSISVSLVTLFLLGLVSARVFKTNIIRGSVRMLVVGGIAIAVGVVVGQFLE